MKFNSLYSSLLQHHYNQSSSLVTNSPSSAKYFKKYSYCQSKYF